MAWVAALGSVVWSAITAAAAAVATAAAIAAVAVYNMIAYVLMTLWSVAAGTVIGVIEGLGLIGTGTSVSIMTSVGVLNSVGTMAWYISSVAISSLITAFTSFLEYIHFATLIQVHEIAYLTSADYREMMTEVYGQISKFSKAIGLGSQFVTLALRNTRNVVLDVSSMLGRGYDLGEVSWLQEMNGFFQAVNQDAQNIAKDPYSILNLLDDKIMKPSLDQKGGVVSGLFSTINGMLTGLDKVVTDIDYLNKDVLRLYSELPENIRSYVKPYIDDYVLPVSEFIEKEYQPQYRRITQTLDIIDVRISDTKNSVSKVVKRLTKPGDIVEGIIGLPPGERAEQAAKLFNTINDPIINEATEAIQLSDTEGKRLESIIKALEDQTSPPDILNLEPVSVGVKNAGEDDTTTTWQVGDY